VRGRRKQESASGVHPLLDCLYLGFGPDERPERLHDAFPGETLTKLCTLKAEHDPDNVFDQKVAVPTARLERAAI
jgi:hypothetical protein